MKLHLGCGTLKLNGFVNIDMRSEVDPDVVADITDLHMYKDGSVELIYFCHGLEHFSIQQVPELLAEFKRVLVDGGELYLSVPDFGVLASEYVFGMANFASIRAAICGGQEYPGNIHYSIWDSSSLYAVLYNAGFVDVSRYNPSDFLPHKAKDYSTATIGNVPISLNVRASC